MGVLDNLKKIKKSQDNKNAISRIARTAVIQGKIERDFLSEYNSFSLALREVLENALMYNKNNSITISAVNNKGEDGENLRYLNYVLQDEEYKAFYDMTMDKSSNVTFKLKYIDISDENFGGVIKKEDTSLDKDYQKDIDFFLNN